MKIKYSLISLQINELVIKERDRDGDRVVIKTKDSMTNSQADTYKSLMMT